MRLIKDAASCFDTLLVVYTPYKFNAIQYDFGINDLTLDILLEKVVLGIQTLKRDDARISKQLLRALLAKNVPGFCTELSEACEILQVNIEELLTVKNVRTYMKKKVIIIQSRELLKRMLLSSKMDRSVVSGFSFDGRMMKYLRELKFVEARAVFMSRYRMWPNKVNFPGRWGENLNCNVCGLLDSDEHVFTCPGYTDILSVAEGLRMEMFWDDKFLTDIKSLKVVAGMVVRLIERMSSIQTI